MIIQIEKWITREMLRANPDKAFLFGDNGVRKGYGGQAKEMRGEPNAFGIYTKILPFTNPSAYLRDSDFEYNCQWISLDFQKVIDSGFKTVVIPEAGLGTGLAELDKRAPKTFAYLQSVIKQWIMSGSCCECRHRTHQANGCLNMASDNDCNCQYNCYRGFVDIAEVGERVDGCACEGAYECIEHENRRLAGKL